jgi:hypothetical protein
LRISTAKRPLDQFDRDAAAYHSRCSLQARLYSLCLRLLENALFFEEVIDPRTNVFPARCSDSFLRFRFLRFRASAKCSCGVARKPVQRDQVLTVKDKATGAPCASPAGPFEFLRSRVPSHGRGAFLPAIAIVRATGPYLSPAVPLPATPQPLLTALFADRAKKDQRDFLRNSSAAARCE